MPFCSALLVPALRDSQTRRRVQADHAAQRCMRTLTPLAAVQTDKSCMPAHATKKLPATTHTATIVPVDVYPSSTVLPLSSLARLAS